MEVVSVTRKGQVTVPIALRRKYGIKEGMKMVVEDSGSGVAFKPIPKLEDLAGIDAGEMTIEEAFAVLDKMRSEDRY
jgi:AbrB family looped-hinge helix DNA binding protein